MAKDCISYASVYPAGNLSGCAAGGTQPGNHSGGGKKSEYADEDSELGSCGDTGDISGRCSS